MRKISEINYVEKCSAREFALHCEPDIMLLINEGICRIFAEYPRVNTPEQQREKLILVHLKKEIEKTIPKNYDYKKKNQPTGKDQSAGGESAWHQNGDTPPESAGKGIRFSAYRVSS